MIHTKRFKKLMTITSKDADEFFKHSRANFIDWLCHLLQTFKKHAPKHLKKYIAFILKSVSAEQAKDRIRATHVMGAGFFDFLKGAGKTIANIASKVGSTVASAGSSFFNNAVPLAKKGFEMAKPYIPDAVAYGVSHIPLVGPTIAPIARKGVDMLLNKFT